MGLYEKAVAPELLSLSGRQALMGRGMARSQCGWRVVSKAARGKREQQLSQIIYKWGPGFYSKLHSPSSGITFVLFVQHLYFPIIKNTKNCTILPVHEFQLLYCPQVYAAIYPHPAHRHTHSFSSEARHQL